MGGLHGIIPRRLRPRMRVEVTDAPIISIIKVVKEQYQVTSSTLSDGLQCSNKKSNAGGIPDINQCAPSRGVILLQRVGRQKSYPQKS